MRVICLGAAMMLALTGSSAAQQRKAAPAPGAVAGRAASAPPVEVRTWVSKTAVWVGDKITYVIELRRCAGRRSLHG